MTMTTENHTVIAVHIDGSIMTLQSRSRETGQRDFDTACINARYVLWLAKDGGAEAVVNEYSVLLAEHESYARDRLE